MGINSSIKLKSKQIPLRPISATSASAAAAILPQQPPSTSIGGITSQKRKSEPDYGAVFNISTNPISNFSNQTECKLQQPTSPVSNDDALDGVVKNGAPKLLQQSIQPNIDVDAVDKRYKRGSIDNLNENVERVKKKKGINGH